MGAGARRAGAVARGPRVTSLSAPRARPEDHRPGWPPRRRVRLRPPQLCPPSPSPTRQFNVPRRAPASSDPTYGSNPGPVHARRAVPAGLRPRAPSLSHALVAGRLRRPPLPAGGFCTTGFGDLGAAGFFFCLDSDWSPGVFVAGMRELMHQPPAALGERAIVCFAPLTRSAR
jgi:hypothetical protein